MPPRQTPVEKVHDNLVEYLSLANMRLEEMVAPVVTRASLPCFHYQPRGGKPPSWWFSTSSPASFSWRRTQRRCHLMECRVVHTPPQSSSDNGRRHGRRHPRDSRRPKAPTGLGRRWMGRCFLQEKLTDCSEAAGHLGPIGRRR